MERLYDRRHTFASLLLAASAPITYVSVQLGHVNDVPAGFDKVEVFRDASGNRKVVSLGLVFLLRSPSDPVALDSATITTVDPQGTILEGQYLRFENGRSTLDVKLARKAGKYDYSGSSQGKPISGSLRVKDPQGLPSGVARHGAWPSSIPAPRLSLYPRA